MERWSSDADSACLAMAGVISGKIAVFGGDAGGDHPLAVTEIYDPATNTWAAGPEMPTPAAQMARQPTMSYKLGEFQPPGRYHLGTVTCRVTSGNPRLVFERSTPLLRGLHTSFGSQNLGMNGCNALIFAGSEAAPNGSAPPSGVLGGCRRSKKSLGRCPRRCVDECWSKGHTLRRFCRTKSDESHSGNDRGLLLPDRGGRGNHEREVHDSEITRMGSRRTGAHQPRAPWTGELAGRAIREKHNGLKRIRTIAIVPSVRNDREYVARLGPICVKVREEVIRASDLVESIVRIHELRRV